MEAGEQDPFPYPNALICDFNQMLIICALRDVPRAQRPTTIPNFVASWAILPSAEWGVKLDVPADVFVVGDHLLDPEYGGKATTLCRRLSRGEVIADRTVCGKAIAKGK